MIRDIVRQYLLTNNTMPDISDAQKDPWFEDAKMRAGLLVDTATKLPSAYGGENWKSPFQDVVERWAAANKKEPHEQ
jgi:hypothetical protein